MNKEKEALVNNFRKCSDVIEETYEFMLAYAAQGRIDEDPSSSPNIRELLQKTKDALEQIINKFELEDGIILDNFSNDFFKIFNLLAEDAEKSLKVVMLALSCKPITSQLVDNINASIHIRTLLTDIFLVDEYLKTKNH
jgi:hypothetical protein